MTSAQETIGIKWYEGTRRWQIFGLKRDRCFYGEYIDHENLEGFKNLEGTVSPEDYQRIVSFVEKIKALPPRTESETGERILSGLLYEGWRGTPQILFRRYESQPAAIHEQLFAEIVEVMRKYV